MILRKDNCQLKVKKCFGSIDENGIVSMDSDMGWWDDLAYGFNQPEKHRHKLPLEVVQYWTEVNHP